MTDDTILEPNLQDDIELPKNIRAKKPKDVEKTYKIRLEEDDTIPPTGLFVAVNGRSFLIRPGFDVDIPASVKEVLDHAVLSAPVIDPNTQQVVGYRDRRRYNYTLISS